jgi:WD40 repeat protein
VSHHHPNGLFTEAFSPDGRWVLAINNAQTTQVLEAVSGRPVSPPLQHPEQVVFAKFSPDGRWVGTVSGKTAHIWDPNTGQRLSVTNTHSIPIRFLAFSADSRRFLTVTGARPGRGDAAAGDQPDEARVWETATGQPVGPAVRLELLSFQAKIGSAALSPDGSLLVTGAVPGQVGLTLPAEGWPMAKIWRVATGNVLYELRHRSSAHHVAFSPDGRWVLTATRDAVNLWEAATGKRIHTWSDPKGAGSGWGILQSPVFSPDNLWVVTITGDRIARVWDVATGRPVSLMHHQDDVHHVTFSPDSRRVVTMSGGKVQVWEAATGQPITPPLLHPDGVRHVSFSLDGRWLLTTSGRTARLWDLSPDSRPTADLIRRAQLLRAGRIDQAGGYELLTVPEIRDAWQTLRTKYPQDFTVTPDQVRDWHRREAEACVREKNAPAAVFHYLHGGWEWLPNTWMLP